MPKGLTAVLNQPGKPPELETLPTPEVEPGRHSHQEHRRRRDVERIVDTSLARLGHRQPAFGGVGDGSDR